MISTSQRDPDRLQDPFDADNLTESLRLKLDTPRDKHRMALGLNTDKVLMIVQVVMFILTVIFGLTVGLALGWAVSVNDTKCPLYAHLVVTSDPANKSLTLQSDSKWGSDSSCNYSTFSAVCIAIYAIIWVWFFVLNSEWDHQVIGVPYDINLLLPALFCSGVLFLVSLVSAGTVSAGYGTWCSYLTQGLSTDGGGEFTGHCSEVRDFYWISNPKASRTYDYLDTAVVGSWLLVIALGIKVTVCAIRVKQHFEVIIKVDEEDDLIDLYRRLEIVQTTLTANPTRKYGTGAIPGNQQKYVKLELQDSTDSEPLGPHEEPGRVGVDTLGLGASALHPDGLEDVGDGGEMSVRSDDAMVVKRRKSRLDSVEGENSEPLSGDFTNLESVPETTV